MTRQTHIIQPIPQLPVSRRGMKRSWLSAIVYRTLCVWLGPTAAFWLTVIGAWTLCVLFMRSLPRVGGLFGSRGGGHYG